MPLGHCSSASSRTSPNSPHSASASMYRDASSMPSRTGCRRVRPPEVRAAAEFARNARQLGSDRVRDGFGDYYRQVMAPKRQLEQDAQGNWISRYDEHGKPDHYAHAETYCLQAMLAPRGFRMSAG